MATYHIDPGGGTIAHAEDLSTGVHRLLLASVERAAASVSTGTDAGVHDARKALKRARALLRLIRAGTVTALYSEERLALREAVRVLGPVRDSYVLGRTLDDVRERTRGKIDPQRLIAIADLFRQRHADEHDRLISGGRATVMNSLQTIQERIAANPPSVSPSILAETDALPTIGRGLRREYKRGRTSADRVAKAPSDENLHRWRKSVKYLRYQLETLEPRWPPDARAFILGLRVLGERLGEDHDLVLLTIAFEDHGIPLGLAVHRTLTTDIHRQRRHLQREAEALAASLYADAPREFVGRLEHQLRRAAS